MSLSNLIGNDKIKDFLIKSIKSNNLLHSYMFIGNEGIGKSLFAQEFSKMILCLSNDSNKPCNNCKACLEFSNNNNPDFIKIESDGKNIKIDQIREMQEKILEKPIISNKKVYIINDADLMTKEAQNCLLKTLEEPPEYIVIILVVANESKMLTTIKSRCTKIAFQKISDVQLKKYMDENYEMKNINANILKMCDGSLGKIIAIKDKSDDYQIIEKLIQDMNRENQIYILNNADILYKNKEEIYSYLEYLNVILFNMACNNAKNKVKYINSINIVEKTKKNLLANSNYDMCIDNLLLKIWEEVNEKYNWC